MMMEKIMKLGANHPEKIAEKSFLRKLQLLSQTSHNLMKELNPLIVKMLKTLRNRYKEEEPKFLGGGAFAQIFEVKPLNSNLSLALKLFLNANEQTLNDIDREKAIADKVHLLLMEDFFSGTIPLFDTLYLISNGEVIFICMEMGVEDESLEKEIERRCSEGKAFTYFNMIKIFNEIAIACSRCTPTTSPTSI